MKATLYLYRNTWGRELLEHEGTRLIFFIGIKNNITLQEEVIKEAEEFKDIVIQDFHDSYRNLPLKTTFLLKWVTDNCVSAKFIMKEPSVF